MIFWYVPIALLGVLALRGQSSHGLLAAIGILVALLNRRFNPKFRWRRVDVVFWSVLALCLINGKSISSYDNYGIGLTTANVAHRGKFELTPLVDCAKDSGYWFRCRSSGGAFTNYPVGNLAVALPVFFSARLVGADLDNHKTVWRLSKLTASFIAALCAVLFFLTASQLSSLKTATTATVLLATGSALWSTVGQGLWSHDGVLLFELLAIYLLVRKPMTYQAAMLFGLCLSMMFANRVASAVLIAPLGLFLLFRSPKMAVVAGISGVLTYLPWAYLHLHYFGHPLGPQFAITSNNSSFFSWANYPFALYGLLFSPGTGLFIYQPWLLLLFLLPWSGKRIDGYFLLFSAMCLTHFFLFGSWKEWSGQICWGTRYLTEIIPVLGLLVLPSLERVRKPWLIGLGVIGFLIQANGVLGPGMGWYHHPLRPNPSMESRALDWRDPAFLYPLLR